MIPPQTSKQNTSQLSADKDNGNRTTQKDISDIDYFENFTLLDIVAPGDQVSELQEEEGQQPPTKPQTEERKPALVKHKSTDSPSVSDDSFVVVTDVEIVGEHLDEVFYGEGPPADVLQRGEGMGEARVRTRRESQRSTKESGSVLFASEETTLTPIFISPGPPKIIDPILLEEPRAMSFMYSDLYEDAVGERRRSDEEYSEAGSVASEKSCKRRFSDSEEADGYLEKFILKDETPAVDVQPESVDDSSEGRLAWPQGKFEMTGSLIRAPQEEEEVEKTKTEEVKKQEVCSGGGLCSGMSVGKREVVSKTDKKEEMQPSIVAQEQAVKRTSGDSNQQLKSTKEQMENQQMQHEVKTDQTEVLEPKTEKPLKPPQMEMKAETSEEHQREEENKQSVHTEQASQTHKMSKEPLVASDMAAPESRQEILQSETENTEKSPSKVAAVDSKTVATDQKAATQAEAEAAAEVTPDSKTFSSTEPLTETNSCTETCLSETKEAPPEDVLEAVADRDSDCELKTQVKIELQDAAEAKTAVSEGEQLQKSSAEEDAAEILSKTDQDPEVKMKILSQVIQPAMLEEVKSESDEKTQQIEQKVIESESSEATPETSSKTPTELTEVCVQDVVNVGDEFILLVPKGQAVEMNIEIAQWTEAAGKDTISPSEPDHAEEGQAPEPQPEEEPKVLVEGLPSNYLDKEDLPLLPEEEDNAEEQKTERDLEEDKVVISPLRSFTPQEDLSGLHVTQSEQVDEEIKVDTYETEEVPQVNIPKEDVPCTDEQSEDVGRHTEQDEVAPDETVAQLGYEMISEQDAQDMPESKTWRDTEKFEPQPEERTETETEKEQREEISGEDVVIEADYEIIDAEEESQARLAAELQGLDWFCSTCECLLSEDEYMSEEHHSHEVKLVEKAYEEVKVRR